MSKDATSRHKNTSMGAHLNDFVVMADDNPELLAALEHLLKRQGLEVHTATEGLTALQMCRRLHPRVVILDLYMPHMSGLEVVAALRKDPDLRHSHVIILSGMVGEVEELASLAPGADRHLTKPIDSDVLLAAVLEGFRSATDRGGLLGRLARR